MEKIKIMKPYELCKKEGLTSLLELSQITTVSVQTLNNWAKSGNTKQDKTKLFECVVLGAAKIKEREIDTPQK